MAISNQDHNKLILSYYHRVEIAMSIILNNQPRPKYSVFSQTKSKSSANQEIYRRVSSLPLRVGFH